MSKIGKREGFECLKTCRPQKTSPQNQQRETARQTADAATLFTIRREGGERGGKGFWKQLSREITLEWRGKPFGFLTWSG